MSRALDVLLVGVGGQGVLTAARILGDAAASAGCPVVVGQLHGMSQRGGSVECSVRIGPHLSSYIRGAPDILVGCDLIEAVRAIPRLGRGTRVVVNRGGIAPAAVAQDRARAPEVDEALDALRTAAASVTVVDAKPLVDRSGTDRTLNAVMLGAVFGLSLLPFGREPMLRAMERRHARRFLEANQRAFALGEGAVSTRRCAGD